MLTFKDMSFFDTLLKRRGYDKCPLPLWRLKLTDSEYSELRQLLEECTHSPGSHHFVGVRREAALFFAEFWRREYVDGSHSKQMVYDALRSPNKDLSDEFFDNACAGAKSLQIEQYIGAKTDYLNSMLYQGGLPMKLLTKNESYSVWDRFTRGLVNRRIDFDELDLGKVATASSSMRDYCKQLIDALERDQYKLMPFYCEDENDNWFIFLKELATQERSRHRQMHPFSLDWEFRIDKPEKRISIKYAIRGLQKLPAAFLDEHSLNKTAFFSAQVRVDGKTGDTFDYVNDFCRYTVVSKHPYVIGQEIALYIHEEDNPLLSDRIDLVVPYLLYKNKEGKYVMGNQLGKLESVLLIPDGWEIENGDSFTVNDYTIEDRRIRALSIGAEFSGDIVTKSADESLTFGQSAQLYWTEMVSNPLYVPDIIDSVYDAKQCKYSLCSDAGETGKAIRAQDMQYRNKWQNEWKSEASYGEIFARVKDADGHFVSPIRFINIGDGLSVSLLDADSETCRLKVRWPHGHVSTNEGILKYNDVWEVKKDACADPRKIQFDFVPDGNGNNQFSLSIRAPFKDFSILDIEGNPVEQNALIPYTDVDKYQYHLVGQDIKSYSFGGVTRELKRYDDKLYIVENGKRIKPIPYEGSLLALFGSREVLRSMLEKTAKSMLDASVEVFFITDDGHRLDFSIKEAPFRVRQSDEGKIEILGSNDKVLDYHGALKLFKMDEPDIQPEVLNYQADKGYVLPESIRPWGNTLLTGRTRGRICPAMVNLCETLDAEYRIKNWPESISSTSSISSINQEIKNCTLDDNFWKRTLSWFECTQREDIPASSILELMCVGSDYMALICMAFQLFAKCSGDEEKETLMGQLKTMSDDLDFQWYWLSPYLDGIISKLQPFIKDINSRLIQRLYIRWAIKQGNRAMERLANLNNPEAYVQNIGECLNDSLKEFTDWVKRLCLLSIEDEYGSHESDLVHDICENIVSSRKNLVHITDRNETFVEENQDNLDEEVEDYFQQYSEPGKSGNEQWLLCRVNAVAAHLNKKADLFLQSHKVRLSIIYCIKSCHEPFLIALNNRLTK